MATIFEEWATALLGAVEIGEDGFYAGHTRALALMLNDMIFSGETAGLVGEEVFALLTQAFYERYPYLAK